MKLFLLNFVMLKRELLNRQKENFYVEITTRHKNVY